LKAGENLFNPKQFNIIPVYKNGERFNHGFKDKNKDFDSDLTGSQLTGKFTYDMKAASMNTYVKNLKTNTVELTDKIFVDRPYQK
jgi:hypothetical protein